MQVTAVIYARVSSKHQAEDEISIDSQIAQCQGRAQALQADVLQIFADRGLSGRVEQRPEFQQAIAFCQQHRVNYFIVWSTSRFARDKFLAASYKRKLAQWQTEVIYVTLPNLERGTDAGFFTESILEIMDEYYSRQIAADTRRAMQQNARQGFFNGGHPPYGYQVIASPHHPKRRQLAVHTAEANVVKLIFQLRMEGLGAKNITRWLRDNGYTRRHTEWQPSTVNHLLRSRAVIGQTVITSRGQEHHHETIESHEAIIPLTHWQLVQRLLDEAVPKSSRAVASRPGQHPLTGLLTCGYCGASLQIESAKSGLYHYYGCRNKQRKLHDCAFRRTRTDFLEEYILSAIGRSVFTVDALRLIVEDLNQEWQNYRETSTQLALEVEAQIRHTTKTINQLTDLAAQLGTNTPASIITRLQQETSQLTSLQQRHCHLMATTDAPPLHLTEELLLTLSSIFINALITPKNPALIRKFLSEFITLISVRQ